MKDYTGGRQMAVKLCAVLFIIFGLCFMGCYEAELLKTAQWIFSDHQTRYMPLASPLIIVSLLIFLAQFINRSIKLISTVHALVYAPSFWVLALMSNAHIPITDATSNGWGGLGFTTWAIVIAVVLWIAHQIPPFNSGNRRTPQVVIAIGNMCIMIVLMACTTLAANTSTHLHITLEMSRLAERGQFDAVLKVGNRTPECNRSICAMRAYALSREGQLPDKLFSFPQHHGVLGLVPLKDDSAYIFNWTQAFYQHLGSVCCEDVTTSSEALYYLKQVLMRHPGRIQADYLLCGYLLERRLDDFASELPHHYAINDSLPRHYKEALIVYQRRNTTPLIKLQDAETEANFAEFQNLKAKYSNIKEQEFHLIDMFHETYWCYYYFPSKQDK